MVKTVTKRKEADDALAAWGKKKGKADSAAPADLARVAALASRQLHLEARVEAMGEELKKLNAELNGIRLDELPTALADVGLSSVTLESGAKVEIKREYYASLTGKYREPALAWLRATGLDDLITFDVIGSFGKGHRKDAERALKALAKFKGAATKAAENINTGSFKAVVREKLEAGIPVPIAEIGVTVIDAAKITPPKTKGAL